MSEKVEEYNIISQNNSHWKYIINSKGEGTVIDLRDIRTLYHSEDYKILELRLKTDGNELQPRKIVINDLDKEYCAKILREIFEFLGV